MGLNSIRVGIIGANIGYGWTPRSHAPAIVEMPGVEFAAVCTSREETAKQSADTYGVPLAFSNHKEMLDKADLDVVAVVVRVPKHYELAMDVLKSGQNIYTEWPLGANLKEAEELTALAKEKKLLTMVGLQSRAAPIFMYLRDLIRENYIGEVLSASLRQFSSGVLSRPPGRTWQKDVELGATTLTIPFGHSIDALCMCLGEFASVSGNVSTKVPQWHEQETNRMVEVSSPDTIMINGTLKGGAAISAHVSAIPHHGSGYRFEIYGTEGTLVVTSNDAPSTGSSKLWQGKAGQSDLAELEIPERYTKVPSSVPTGPPFNIAQLWDRFAEGIKSNTEFEPSFSTALTRHKLIDAIQKSSDTGTTQEL
ncbi:Gfo/Idh/MocA family oxidoreductase [Chloroflexi bacterium]|nr:Gfo/Idh/MocA family oxidoreductase [Chloroflexota bacterium]